MSIFRALHIIASAIIGTVCASCAPTLTQLPAGPGTPTAGQETGFVYFDASRQPCSLEPITGEAAIRGTIGGTPINGRFSFAAATLRLRLESLRGNPRDFVFTAQEGTDAFLYRGAYRIVGRSADVIETILGLPLHAEDLRRVLTGCPRISGSFEGRRIDDRWFQVRLDGEAGYAVSAQRTSDGLGWTIRAIDGPIVGTTNRWRAAFERASNGLLESVHLASTSWAGAPGERFAVRISFRHLRVNAQLPPETFRIEQSPSMPTVDLDGLRRSRPASAPFLVDPRVR